MTSEYQTFYLDAHRLILGFLIIITRGFALRGSLYQAFVSECGTDAGLQIKTSCPAKNMYISSNFISFRSDEACYVGLCEGGEDFRVIAASPQS
jgi:hypothetical protein